MSTLIVLSFGKFKGRMLHKCPSSYLRYLSTEAWDDQVATAADEEWQLRDHQNTHWEEGD